MTRLSALDERGLVKPAAHPIHATTIAQRQKCRALRDRLDAAMALNAAKPHRLSYAKRLRAKLVRHLTANDRIYLARFLTLYADAIEAECGSLERAASFVPAALAGAVELQRSIAA